MTLSLFILRSLRRKSAGMLKAVVKKLLRTHGCYWL
jgi:hypothetical protein